jgi:hypothetical protein
MHNQDAPFDFYDVSMKVTSASPLLGKDDKLSLFGFFSKDQVVRDDPFKSDYAVSNNVYGISSDRNTGEQVFMLRFFPSLSVKVDW